MALELESIGVNQLAAGTEAGVCILPCALASRKLQGLQWKRLGGVATVWGVRSTLASGGLDRPARGALAGSAAPFARRRWTYWGKIAIDFGAVTQAGSRTYLVAAAEAAVLLVPAQKRTRVWNAVAAPWHSGFGSRHWLLAQLRFGDRDGFARCNSSAVDGSRIAAPSASTWMVRG